MKSYIVKLAVNILTNNPSPPNINIENNFFFILYLSSVNQYLHDWREVLNYTNTLFYLIQSNMPIRSPQSNMPIRSPQSNMPIRSPVKHAHQVTSVKPAHQGHLYYAVISYELNLFQEVTCLKRPLLLWPKGNLLIQVWLFYFSTIKFHLPPISIRGFVWYCHWYLYQPVSCYYAAYKCTSIIYIIYFFSKLFVTYIAVSI